MENEACFQDLASLDKPDWPNIPLTLIRTFRTMKKCLLSLLYGLKENNDKIEEVSRENSFKLQEFDVELKSVRKSTIMIEDLAKSSMLNLTDKLSSFIANINEQIFNEFEIIKKNNDAKFQSSDNQLKSLQNALKNFPKYEEVERIVKSFMKSNNAKLEIEIKEDIKTNMFDPEFRKNQDKFEKIELYKDEVKQKFAESNEERSKLFKNLTYEFELKTVKLKKSQDSFKEKLEKLTDSHDYDLQEINGRLDKLNKAISEKYKVLDNSILDIFERNLKNIRELQTQIESLKQETAALKLLIPENPPESPPEKTETISFEVPEAKREIKKKKSKKREVKTVDMSEDFKKLKDFILESTKTSEELLKKNSALFQSDIEEMIKSLRKDMHDSVFQIKEKLHWLPVNVSEIKGMTPNEARIFILEARMRAEENARNEQFNKLTNQIDSIKVDLRCGSEVPGCSVALPNLTTSTLESKGNNLKLKDYSARIASSIRDVPTPERLKHKQANQRLFMSVDIARSKQRRLSS